MVGWGGLALVAWAKARNRRFQVLSPLRASGATAIPRRRLRSGSAGQSQRNLEDLSATKIEAHRNRLEATPLKPKCGFFLNGCPDRLPAAKLLQTTLVSTVRDP